MSLPGRIVALIWPLPDRLAPVDSRARDDETRQGHTVKKKIYIYEARVSPRGRN